MITATVRYKLPLHIDYAACREHFHKIAPGFREVKGLISKHFIWSASGRRVQHRRVSGPLSESLGVNFHNVLAPG